MGEYINLGIHDSGFIKEYFEKKFHCFRCAVDVNSYSWDIFSSDFYGIDPTSGCISIHRNGIVNLREYINGVEDYDGVRYEFNGKILEKYLNDGSTIVVNRFENYSRFVLGLCVELSKITVNFVTGNAYITKGGDGTFGKHWDTHCVFAIQLKGRKRWKVYKPTQELPLSFQTSVEKKRNFNGDLVFDDVLNECDILYIPRGWWHEVNPIKGTPSLHISMGVHTPKVHDYIKWLIIRKMSDHIDFRRSINKDFIESEILYSALERLLQDALLKSNYDEYLNEIFHLANLRQAFDFSNFFSVNE